MANYRIEAGSDGTSVSVRGSETWDIIELLEAHEAVRVILSVNGGDKAFTANLRLGNSEIVLTAEEEAMQTLAITLAKALNNQVIVA